MDRGAWQAIVPWDRKESAMTYTLRVSLSSFIHTHTKPGLDRLINMPKITELVR